MSKRRLLLTAAASALLLAACNQTPAGPVSGAPIASLPLATAAPPPETPAPDASALPPAAPIMRAERAPSSVYDYVDDAYALNDAFADSPPDYTVDYDGARPWIWRASDGEYRVAEDTPDGEREYYYRGDSDYPFLVRDSGYCYAYDDAGELVEVYDSYGRPYPNYGAAVLEIAAQYLFRARHLHYAAMHDQRQAAYASDWRAQRDAVLAPQQQWAVEEQRNPDWRRLRDARVQAPPPQLAALQQERTQRQTYASRVAPVIASAPPAPPRAAPQPMRSGLSGERASAAPQGGQPPSAPSATGPRQSFGPPHSPTEAAANSRGESQRQPPAQGQAQQQQAQAQARAQAQQQQAQAQARDQQHSAQLEAANRARSEAQRQQQAQALAQQQQAQAHQAQASAQQQQQQRQAAAQAQAANQARAEASRQAQAAQQHQQQAQAAASQHQAEAAAQHAQAAAQHAQAAADQQHAAVQHAQAAAQHAQAAQHPEKPKPDDQKK